MNEIVCFVVVGILYIACGIVTSAFALAMEYTDKDDGTILFMIIVWPIVLLVYLIGFTATATRYLADKIRNKFFQR